VINYSNSLGPRLILRHHRPIVLAFAMRERAHQAISRHTLPVGSGTPTASRTTIDVFESEHRGAGLGCAKVC
jgi:hypothetical protein